VSAPILDQTMAPSANTMATALRVCLVTEAGGGGVGRHFLDLARGLADQGVKATCVYSAGRSDAQFQQRLARVNGVQLVEFPMRRAMHWTDIVDLRGLVRLLRRLGPFDVIHGHSSKGGALSRLAARWLSIPSVYTPNAFVTLDPTLPSWRRSAYAWIERWLARHSSAVIAVSSDEARHARALGIATEKIHVVNNGIEQPEFPPREEVRSQLGLSPHDFVVGFVGRLSAQKAPENLLEAFLGVYARDAASALVLVGGGPLDAMLRARAEALGLNSRVKLLGDVVATQIMPAFDVFCLSSRYEGMPYVLLESLAAGLPIVATRVGGVKMCVEPEVNGLIVPPENVNALSAALLRLAGDRPLAQRFAAASAAKAGQFTAERMVAQTLDVYRDVLARRANN
jgi:glycosyltransferase involved in cell wall biosynthesis